MNKLLLAILLMLPLSALAENLSFTADFDDDWRTDFIHLPGTLDCPGGSLLLSTFGYVCSEGSNIHIRDTVVLSHLESDSDFLNGLAYYVLNCNFDDMGDGPCSGTVQVMPYAYPGQMFSGTYTGKRTYLGNGLWKGEFNAKAMGYGPDLAGWKMTADLIHDGYSVYPSAFELLPYVTQEIEGVGIATLNWSDD